MDDGNGLLKPDGEARAIQPLNPTNPIAAVLNSVVEKGITTENAATMRELFDLYERMENRGAKQAFAAAMAALQAELPRVTANRFIPDSSGGVRSRFADYGAIMEAIEPFLTKHGFSVSFTIKYDGPRLIAVCRMRHIGGHEEANEFGVRIGSGPPKASEAQADGAARSYARRGALCDALNIVVDHDDDARTRGSPISAELAANLRERVRAIGADEEKLMRFAGVESYEDIPRSRYDEINDMLKQKEAKHRASPRADDDFAGQMAREMDQTAAARNRPGARR